MILKSIFVVASTGTKVNSVFLHNNVRTTCKIAVNLNPDVAGKIERVELKHRHHPGIIKAGNLTLPDNIKNAIARSVGDYPIKTVVEDAKKINQYLRSRHPPPENKNIQEKIASISLELEKKYPTPTESDELTATEFEKIKKRRLQQIQNILKQRVFAWKPISYGAYEALVYAVARSAKEYAVLTSIFREINTRQPEFIPKSFIDFGSGIGTAMWAASGIWKDYIFEYLNVDSSRDMNDLSELILKDGNENQQPRLRNVNYRQFLPSSDTSYDIAVSAFSLFELPNAKERKQVILNLWRKCTGFLVIVEEGTRKGFELVAEARKFIVNMTEENLVGQIFAPCPHRMHCPRLTNQEDKTPCNFEVIHESLGLGERVPERQRTRYSYIVFQKLPEKNPNSDWPRIVRPPLVRSKHTVCRLCIPKGTLQEIIFTQSKHGRDVYRCARSSRWGDRLPIQIGDEWKSDKSKRKKRITTPTEEEPQE